MIRFGSASPALTDEDAEHMLEVAAVHDQEPVETFAADGADEAFSDRVRLRRLYRRLDDLDSVACEDGVEAARELAVAVCVLQAAMDLPVEVRSG
jgi:hypothetical protein